MKQTIEQQFTLLSARLNLSVFVLTSSIEEKIEIANLIDDKKMLLL